MVPYRSFRLPRVRTNAMLRQIAPLFSGAVINVSGWDDRDKEGGTYRSYFTGADSYAISNHAGERGLADAEAFTDHAIDLTGTLPDDLRGRFDLVFNHTTLEHIFDVHTAFANLCTLSKDAVLVIVPFAQEVHTTESFGDYWRITPMALRELFRRNGMTVVYEAANDDPNAGNYVLAVGSRKPEAWRGVLPAYEPVDRLSEWIGVSWKRRLKAALLRRPAR